MKTKILNGLIALVAMVALVVAISVAVRPTEQPVELAAGACSRAAGGAKWIAGSGCEWEMQSGSTLDVQSGTSTTFGGNVDVDGTLQFSSNNLYPVGYASSGQQLVYGTSQITGTATASHGLTTVTFAVATLGEDPSATAGHAAHVSLVAASNVITLKAWQDDFVTAATETDVDIHWLVVGAP